MLKFYPEKTKIVFFDLEYYVPPSDRERKTTSGMLFSPHLDGHKILGGSFTTYYPFLDKSENPVGFWEWSLGSEEVVVKAIFRHLEDQWKSIEAKNRAGSLMLGGIGISHSDVAVLLVRCMAHSVAEPSRIHDVLFGCRQIDLSLTTYCQFSFNKAYFSYPKSKSQLYQKYLGSGPLESGKSVWDMYEKTEYKLIEQRCDEEVETSLAIYKGMFKAKAENVKSLKKLKKLEKEIAEQDAPNET